MSQSTSIRRHSTLLTIGSRLRAEGWRIWQSDKGRWWAQRQRPDVMGYEVYEDAEADTLVQLVAKLAGVILPYRKPTFTVYG